MSENGQAGVLDRPLRTLGLPVRVRGALVREGIGTVGELAVRSEEDLDLVPGFGRMSLADVRQALAGLGLELSETSWYETPEGRQWRGEHEQARQVRMAAFTGYREQQEERDRRLERIEGAVERIEGALERIAGALEKTGGGSR